jgi:general secretion pathway protein N
MPCWRFLSAVLFLIPAVDFVQAQERQHDALQLETLEATRSRPLFSPSRRPPPPVIAMSAPVVAAAPVVPDPHATPPDLHLIGVIVGSDEQRAIVKRAREVKSFGVAAGDQIDGWTVAHIEPRQIILQHDEKSATIAFSAAKK